jgi:hypothetical protein
MAPDDDIPPDDEGVHNDGATDEKSADKFGDTGSSPPDTAPPGPAKRPRGAPPPPPATPTNRFVLPPRAPTLAEWAGLTSARQTASLLFAAPGQVVELRALGALRGKAVTSGYFDDSDKFVAAAFALDGRARGIYATLNVVTPELLGRAHNRVVEYADQTTADSNILTRKFLLIDFDPRRLSGISSTDAELEAARQLACDVETYLTSLGFPAPVRAESGNGIHLLYRVDISIEDEPTVGAVLEALAFRFDTSAVAIDTSVSSRGQLTKLYGTMVRKGDSTPDRPHRRSRIVSIPEQLQAVPIDTLVTVAIQSSPKFAPKKVERSSSGQRIDVGALLERAGMSVARTGPWQGGTRWILDACPFNAEHTDGAAYVVQFANGAVAAGCHHASCQGKTWRDLRDLIEPNRQTSSQPANASTASPTAPSRSSHSTPIAAAPGQFVVGDLVSPCDRENVGEVVDVCLGRVLVHFVSPEGEEADKFFVPAALKFIRRKAQHAEIRILSTRELLGLPPPKWLVKGVLRQGELAVIYGQPGCGKTFVAVDLAVRVAHGLDWYGSQVTKGPTLYIAAEGRTGLALRLRAWSGGSIASPDSDPWTNFNVIGDAVQFLDEQFDEFLALLATLAVQPLLIIVDTLARCSVGGDENSAKDMGRLVQAGDRLRKQTDATVIIVHHANKGESQGAASLRGSSALHGAVDTLLEVASDTTQKMHITLTCKKQKEAEVFAPIAFELERIKVDAGDGSEPIEGCRLTLRQGHPSRKPRTPETPASLKILQTLKESFPSKSVTATTLRETAKVPKSTFYKTLQRLVRDEEVVETTIRGTDHYGLPKKINTPPVSTVSDGLSGGRDSAGPEVSPNRPPKGGRGQETGPETPPPGHDEGGMQ